MLLINIFVQNKYSKSPEEIRTENFVYEIDSIFTDVINEYALESSWIKKVPIDNENFDSLNYVCNISIPPDLSVSELLQEINGAFQKTESYFVSEELKNYGKSSVKIYSGGILKYQAYIATDSKIFRNRTKFALLIDLINDTAEPGLDKFLKLPFVYTLLLLPSKESFEMKYTLISNNKRYGIVVGDQEIYENYILDEKFEREKLLSNIENIISDFNDATLFIIDDDSDLYGSAVYSFIKNEFSNNGIQLLKKSKFKKLTAQNNNEVISLFNFLTAGEDISTTHNVIISFENFKLLQTKIKEVIKKGTKFVYIN